jgi:spore germination protein YaaH
MTKQVFFDPQRKRWKRLRRIFDIVALAGVVVGVLFVVGLLRMTPLPELLRQTPKANLSAVQLQSVPSRNSQKTRHASLHRKTTKRASEITLNSGEGLRAAYYVEDDPASYSSLKQHIRQIDLLFPEWIHVVSSDGALTSYSLDNRPFHVVDASGVHGVDHENRVARVIAGASDETPAEIFPLVNNYDPIKNVFLPSIGDFLANPDSRAHFIDQVDAFLAANPSYRGISLDFEEIPSEAQQSYMALVGALYQNFQARHLKLYINTPVGDDDFDLKYIADHSDGILLMSYDQHTIGTDPGPIAAQDWFLDNLKQALKVAPKEKIICAIGSYGYDWTTNIPVAPRKGAKAPPAKVLSTQEMSTQDAWQAAEDSDAQVELDPD